MADTMAGSSPPVRALFLGPTRIHVDGGDPLEITNLQARLLAQLAIAAPASLSTEQLIDALWPDERPANARASLYNQVSRLRARTGVDVVRSNDGGYSLVVPTDIDLLSEALFDVERFVRMGAFDAAERYASDAIGLWRGTPLHELDEDDRRAAVIRRRAAESLRSLHTLRVQAAVGAGRTAWAVPEAERLVGETPGDERRWALLVDALGAAGRRGDAFAAFERARRGLAESLGLEPGKLLNAAYERLLRPVEHGSRAPSPLVGREEFIAEVLDGLDDSRTTLLHGEHGIGKTRLLAVIGNRLSRAGFRVASVAATRHPTQTAQVLHEIADALGSTIDPSVQPTLGFMNMLNAVVADGSQVVILVDDASNLGPASGIAIAAATRVDRVSLILTSRTRLSLLREASVRRLEIPPLTEAEVASLVESRLGTSPSPEVVSWIWTMSGGNPELVELLASQPLEGVPPPDSGDFDLARLLNGLVRTHTEHLSAAAFHALEVVAVLGKANRSLLVEFVAKDGLEEALSNGLLDEADNGLIDFRHGALRSALYNAMAPGRRGEYDAFVLRVLDRLGASADRIAPHALACRDADPLTAARVLLRAAGKDAPAVPASRAEPWFRLVLNLAEALGEPGKDIVAAAQIGLAEQLRRLGHPDQREAAREAVRRAEGTGRTKLIIEACHVAARVMGIGADGTVDPEIADLIRRSLAIAETSDQVAVVLIGCAELPPAPSLERSGRRAALDALDLPVTPDGRRRVWYAAGRVLGSPADLETRSALAEEGRGHTPSEYLHAFDQALYELPQFLMRCDGSGAAERSAVLETGRSSLIDHDTRVTHGLYSALLSYLNDDLDGAERGLDTLGELVTVTPSLCAPIRMLGNLAAVRLAQRREHELLERLAEYHAMQPTVRYWSALRARCLARTDPGLATELALEATDETIDHPLWALTAAHCGAVAVATSNAELASHTIERLGDWSGQFICTAGVSGGLVDAALAGASLVLGRFGHATEYLSRARVQARTLRAPALTRDLDALAERITTTLLQHGVAGAN